MEIKLVILVTNERALKETHKKLKFEHDRGIALLFLHFMSGQSLCWLKCYTASVVTTIRFLRTCKYIVNYISTNVSAPYFIG